ncbi:hypothetical protein BRD00_10100 [Halobacteriales archaeon QS_8_69_26]|nr:MAG: hypothetical protein BRD00_10100 [Halobacteriales archaeon QS_8_69_26]
MIPRPRGARWTRNTAIPRLEPGREHGVVDRSVRSGADPNATVPLPAGSGDLDPGTTNTAS